VARKIRHELLRASLSSADRYECGETRDDAANDLSVRILGGGHWSMNRLPTLVVTLIALLVVGVVPTAHASNVAIVTSSSPQHDTMPSRSRIAASSADLSAQTGGSPVVASIPVGHFPDAVTFDNASGYVYVANAASDNVSVISGTSLYGTIELQGNYNLAGIAFDPADEDVYVTNSYGNISLVHGTSTVGSIPDPGTPDGATFDPVNGYLYVADYESGQSGNVTLIAGTTVVTTIPVGAGASAATFDSSDGCVYVTDFGDGTGDGSVTVINGTSVVATIPVGIGPSGAAFNPARGTVYVTNYDSDNVSVIAGTQVVATVPVGVGPSGLAFDPINGYIYVANSAVSANNLTVINGTSVITSIPVNYAPDAAAFDSDNGFVYITDLDSGNVTVVNGTFYFPSIASFTASPATVEIGSKTTGTTTFAVTANAGRGSATYAYSGLPEGCSTSNTAALVCTPTQAGVYTVQVCVNNSEGYTAAATTKLTVVAALSAEATGGPNPADADSPVDFHSNPTGGSGVNSYEWKFGDGGSSALENPTHEYASPGAYAARVWINDTYGGSVAETLSIVVDTELTVALAASNTTPALGESILINATVSGGAAPYAYAYLGLPPGCMSIDRPSIGCLPTQAGFYNVSVNVTDNNGVTTSTSSVLEIIFEFTVEAPSEDTINHPFTLSVRALAGEGGVTYGYSGLPPGCASIDAPELTCVPTQVGSYNISVSVRDDAGDHAVRYVSLKVVPSGPATFWSVLGTPLVFDGSLAAVVATLLVATIIGSRRRRDDATTSGPYGAYQVSSRTNLTPRLKPSGPAQARGKSASTGSSNENEPEDDSLSDLV
jgi:YVTN family beta-propeller protein